MASYNDFGWWIESTDEEIYGPVTKDTLTRFLSEGVISPNTAVRHCTQIKFAPAADQGMTDGLDLSGVRRTGDKLSEAWPNKYKDRMELAESDVECAYHRRPAILSCIRCQAPYCSKCQMNRKKSTYFLCKKCQGSVYNRRVGAYLVDNFTLMLIPIYGVGIPAIIVLGPESGTQVINLFAFVGTAAFVFRDALFGGAGPGKRLFGVHVVKREDGIQKPSFGQGFLRCVPHLIPLFNLLDAHVCYADPLQKRFGDKWAKTRVIDTDAKLEKARDRVRMKLEKKGIKLTDTPLMTMQEFAHID